MYRVGTYLVSGAMSNSSFRNWQAKYIEQSQSASTTMLGLSGGALAFSATLLSGHANYLGYCQSVLFHLHGLLQLLSMGTAVWFSVNRSRDFSLTARIARLRSSAPQDARLPDLRSKSKRLGIVSRRLVFTQGVLFLCAAAFFVLFVLAKHSHALYPPLRASDSSQEPSLGSELVITLPRGQGPASSAASTSLRWEYTFNRPQSISGELPGNGGTL